MEKEKKQKSVLEDLFKDLVNIQTQGWEDVSFEETGEMRVDNSVEGIDSVS